MKFFFFCYSHITLCEYFCAYHFHDVLLALICFYFEYNAHFIRTMYLAETATMAGGEKKKERMKEMKCRIKAR